MSFTALWGDESPDGDSGKSEDDNDNAESEAARREVNRKRTQKAREAARVGRLQKQVKELREEKGQTAGLSWSKSIQENYFTSFFNEAPSRTKRDAFAKPDFKRIGRERGRAVMSFLFQIPGVLRKLLAPKKNDRQQEFAVQQITNCVIMDDTSSRVRGADGAAVIHSIMNTVQSLHVAYGNSSWESLQIPTPCICLPSQKTDAVYQGYAFGSLLSSQGVGRLFQSLDNMVTSANEGLQPIARLFQQPTWKIQVFVGDALPTNDAIFKLECNLLEQASKTNVWGASGLRMIRFKCALHQVCLVRKPVVLSIDNFWTNLVRLAHLFEQSSFKKQFAVAILQRLNSVGGFRRILVEKKWWNGKVIQFFHVIIRIANCCICIWHLKKNSEYSK